MKMRLQDRLIVRLSVATMLALSIALPLPLHISRGSSAPDVNDVDGVAQAAKNGIASLNSRNSAALHRISSALENFASAVASLDKQANVLTGLKLEITNTMLKIEAANKTIKAILSQIGSIDLSEFGPPECSALIRAMEEHYARLITLLQNKIAEAEAKNQSTASLKEELAALQKKRDAELQKLAALCGTVLSEVEKLEEQVEQTAKARRILDKLSTDRTKASQLVQLIRTNNRTGLSEFLRREAGGGDFVISEAKVMTGPLLVFRVDSISHCLSVGNQCSGKSYLISK